MVYPDVKYTDFVEKCYRFISPSWINALYLNRHEVENKAEFVDDMFSKFTIEYLNEGEWYPLNNSGATVAEHPAYNRLSFTPIKRKVFVLLIKTLRIWNGIFISWEFKNN